MSKMLVEHVAHDDYLQEDMKKWIKEFNEKLEEKCLDDTNFVLQGENCVDLKMLEDIVNEDGINAMADVINMLTDEEYGDMLINE